MRQHLLRVDRGAEAFESLIDAAGHAGERVGWLELTPPAPGPEGLEAAAARGVLRAVAAGGGRSVAVKPMRGEPVLEDLLREHFRGCVLVLVRGEPKKDLAAPRLEPLGEGWRIRFEGAPERLFTTDQLLAALRRPHPWGRSLPRRREKRK